MDSCDHLLEAELETDLGYSKNEKTGNSEQNRRNGHSTKKIRSEYGEMDLTVPRDRVGTFEPMVVKKHQKNVTRIKDQILPLYAKGVSTCEIQDHLQNLYGIEVSPTLISNVTAKIMPMV